MEVVSSAHGAFGPLLGKLAAECGRLKAVRREIRSLRSELASMHAALKEYTKLEDPNDQVKTWISLVRELAYDTEDVFDKFIHQLGNGQDHGGFKEFFRKTARRLKTLGARHGIAGQIDDLKDRIKEVKQLKDSYKLNDAPSSTTGHAVVDPRLRALFAEEAHLVGVDGPRDDLAKWMVESNDSSKQCRVLSVVGLGGLGKTTLANEVYRKIQGEFTCRAFVSVSQKPDIKKIIKDVISQIQVQDGSTEDTSDWDEKKSIAMLREMLHDKRYLIIIDDVWSTEAWHTIKCAFPENNCSSRIIATTRIVDVAKSCCLSIDDRMYEMEALDDLHSRRLFFKRIFGSDDRCPDTLNEVSSEILKKCGGLPLAIISISSLLANRSATREEWDKVKRSIGYSMENNQSLEGMNAILSLGYNDLSPNLKTCLLYLSVFPEDYVISRERLVRRWIAEGFISEQRGHSREEVAKNYFYELINKNMVQPVDITDDGKVRACRVHDMMLEIIISKSAEENFMTVVGGGQKSLTNRHGFIRRLSIQHIDEELASALAKEDLSHVRSLTVTSSVSMKHLPSIGKYKALRVLDFEDCRGLEEYDMNHMETLFQLKYLSLSGTELSKLVPKVVMLHDLETLDISNTDIKEFPDGIGLLTKLEYLLTGKHFKVPKGIGNMRSLQLFPCFDIIKSSLDAVGELKTLPRLDGIILELDCEDGCKGHQEMILSSLCKLGSCKIKSVRISGGGLLNFMDFLSPAPTYIQVFFMSSDIHLANIPKWFSRELTNLGCLDIHVNQLEEEGLHTLGELPAVHYLYLASDKKPKTQLIVIGFPCVKNFRLFCTDGAYVKFVKGAMPKLEAFRQSFDVSVARTYEFYLGIEHLPCLKSIEVSNWNKGATLSECKAAASAIKNEAHSHPKHPEVIISGSMYVDNKWIYIDIDDQTSEDEN